MNCHLFLRSLVSSTVKNCKKHIHTSAARRADVWEPDHRGRTKTRIFVPKKSEAELLWEEKSYIEKLKLEYKLYKKHFGLLKQEIKDHFRYPNYIYRRGEVDVCWRFSDNPECLDDWIVTADSDCDDGFSTANLELSPIGTGIFSGVLDTKLPEDGEVTHTGYCNIRTVNVTKSFLRETTLNWEDYTHLRMRVRGDGRVYFINLGLKQTFDVQWFHICKYLLMTRGGPYWQDIKIPLSKFFLTHKGAVQDRQQGLEKHKVKNFGITLADKTPGPFKLEIDWIGVECDEYLDEENAYESYYIDTNRI